MEIYEREDGWYYCGEDCVEWGPFESYDEAEMMSLTPETGVEPRTSGNRSSSGSGSV